MTGSEVFLGIDLGTSGCRAAAVTSRGDLLALHKVNLPPSRQPAPGRSEQNPDLWWQALCRAIQGLLAQLGPRPLAGLALDGTSGTLLLLDRQGRPLTPGMMYDDARGRTVLTRLAGLASPDSAVHGATSSLAKLLATLASEVPAGTAHACHQAEWLAGCLTGDFGHGDENNCLKLGYDPVARQWPAWLAELGVPIPWLPAVQPAGSRLGSISAAAHRATGLPAGLPVFAGTTDSVAAALAAGMAAPGDAVTSLGSTLALKILADRPVVSAAHGVYSHRLFDRWLAGGASNSGGAVLRAYFSAAEMAELTPRLQPQQPTGLDYYPLLRPGERFPVNDPGLRPRLTPRPADRLRFFQGLLEGIARIEQSAYGLLRQLGAPPPARVITTGGGAANRPWRQMRESLLGVPVVAAECTEAAVGAALLACRGAGGA